jgi:hypothetical protein
LKYGWKEFLEKCSKEQTLTTPERYKEGVLMFFDAIRQQLSEEDPEKIRPLNIHFFGKFIPNVRQMVQRLATIERIMTYDALVQPEEHLKQIEIIDYFLKKERNYGKFAERIQRIRQALVEGRCGFGGDTASQVKSDS